MQITTSQLLDDEPPFLREGEEEIRQELAKLKQLLETAMEPSLHEAQWEHLMVLLKCQVDKRLVAANRRLSGSAALDNPIPALRRELAKRLGK